MGKLNLLKYGKNHPLTFGITSYLSDNSLAITMTTWEEGYAEPWDSLTVNLEVDLEDNCAFIDTNNNGGDIIDWLIKNNLGELTGRVKKSGFCSYPEFKFDLGAVEKYN